MLDRDTYLRKAEALLSRAAHAENMAERSRLIDEALHWHNLALQAEGHSELRLHDNDEQDVAGPDVACGFYRSAARPA